MVFFSGMCSTLTQTFIVKFDTAIESQQFQLYSFTQNVHETMFGSIDIRFWLASVVLNTLYAMDYSSKLSSHLIHHSMQTFAHKDHAQWHVLRAKHDEYVY